MITRSVSTELFGKRRTGHEGPGVAAFHTADSSQVRGHIQPVQTVGREPQMEPEGVRRIFQAGRLREAVGTAGDRHLRPVQQHRAENPNRYVHCYPCTPTHLDLTLRN